MGKILEGIRILDVCRFIAGPYCSTLLGEMGAEVIRVEEPGGAADRFIGVLMKNGQGVGYYNNSRCKKGITLNLKSERGKELLKELASKVDVLVENFGGGVMERLGLDYETIKPLNPSIIYVSVSGFGQTGPYKEKTSFDPVGQAMSGHMSVTGFPDKPPTRSAIAWVDFSTSLHACIGTLLALYHKKNTGVGQFIDVAMMDTAFSLMSGMYAEYLVEGLIRPQLGNHFYHQPGDLYKSKDGWVFISPLSERIWKRMAEAMEIEQVLDDPRFETMYSRYEHREVLSELIEGWTTKRTSAEVLEALEKARVPCGRVYTIPEIVEDPHIKARNMKIDLEYPDIGNYPTSGVVIKMSETPGSTFHAPAIGEHNEEIYCGLLGLSKEEVAGLSEEGVI
jgi:crotonobetainyl-CoA:carnitine CoA-transferase CaiB-like acyl-CoA transferase